MQQPQFAYAPLLEQPKIVFPDISTECRFALDTQGRFGANTVYFIPCADLALLALLNSRVALFYLRQTCAALEGPGESYLRFFGQYLECLPICEIPDRQRDNLVRLVERIHALKERRLQARLAHEQTALDRQIADCDRRIDEAVYELYGLSGEEIRLVEDAAEQPPVS